MKKTTLKWGVIAVAGVAIVAGGYSYLQVEPAPDYATESVTHGNIEQVVLANGLLQASKLVNVGAQVSGQIQHLAVDLGQNIHKGDLIAQIDSLTQQNNLKEAQASLNSLNAQYQAKQAQMKQAQFEFQRQKGMLAAKASSRSEYETAEANLAVVQAALEQLNAEIEQAKIKVDSAKLDLGYTTISAPMDGTVVYTAVEEGQTVNSNQTTPTIIELAQLDKMTVKAQISEADVIHVKPGQESYFTILGQPNHKYHAVLEAIEPGPTIMTGDDSKMAASDSDAIYYNALFEVDNPDRILRIGMTAQVSIVLNQAKDVLMVPSQVLVPGADGVQVPVLEKGKLEYKNVTVGINDKVHAQILSGLEEGDQVVVGMPSDETFSASRGRRVRL